MKKKLVVSQSPDSEQIAVVRVKRTEADDNETDQYEQKGARTVIIAKWNNKSGTAGNFETKSTATKNIIKKQIRSIVWVPTAKKG